MKKHIKKVLSCIMATVLCLSFNATAFASEATEPAIEQSAQSQNADIQFYTISSNGDIMPLSSISGYGQATLTSDVKGMLVTCSASGLGGMGITVDTSCRNTYQVHLVGEPTSATISTSKIDTQISTNDHYENGRLHHSGDFRYYLIGLDGIRSRDEVLVKVWIYG